jgi:FkbM family methyltransferase
MTLLKTIFKFPLDALSLILKQSNAAIYYLVNEALKKEIASAFKLGSAYEHIHESCRILKNSKYAEYQIIDIGGGQGTTAQIFSYYFPKSQIIIYEPINLNIEAIRNKSNEYKFWEVRQKALGDKSGKSVININKRITASSILETNANEHLYHDSLDTIDQQEITITTLDTEFGAETKVGIMKLDIQGYELAALHGGEKTLSNTFLVVLEINNHESYLKTPKYYEIDAYLRFKHFSLINIFPANFENHRLLDWDALYINDKFS